MQFSVAGPRPLRAVGTLPGRGPARPSADVRLIAEGVKLRAMEGVRPIVKQITLEAEPGYLDGVHYWKGQFIVRLRNVYSEPEPYTTLEVNLGGRITIEEVLAGLGQHIRQRSKYGAQLERGEVLYIYEPTANKVREPRRGAGLGALLGDGYVFGATSPV